MGAMLSVVKMGLGNDLSVMRHRRNAVREATDGVESMLSRTSMIVVRQTSRGARELTA
jgi:hypothetical protein